MNKLPPILLAVLLAAPLAGEDRNSDFLERERLPLDQALSLPRVDPKRLVKDSNSFLKEREPEMTPEEYALYEKIAGMLATNPDLAVRMLEAMVNEKERPSPAFEFILGNAYYAANQTERAEKSYRSAVERFPEFVRSWKNLGVLCYSSSRFPEAVKCFSKAVVLGDREPSTFGLMGYCLERQDNPIAAEMAYMQALGGDPANSDWKEGLLRIYIAAKQYGRAEPLVRSLIKERPTEARLWLNYAGLLLADQRKLEAMAVLETAQAAGAAGPDEFALLGDLYAEQGLAAEAAAAYTKVLGPARARGEQKLLQFAQVLIAAGRLPEAEQTLALLKGEPTPAGRLALLQVRADLLMAKKLWPEARREIDMLLAVAPLNGRALLALGRTHLEERDLPHAAFAFEAACRIPETAYPASLELANIELKNHRYAKAVEYLERALRLQRTDAVEDYLARVKTLVPADPPSG
jgi:tetratricopeptide (TPR) repeat protein